MKTIAIITDGSGVQVPAEPIPDLSMRTVCNGTNYLVAETQEDLNQLNADYPPLV